MASRRSSRAAPQHVPGQRGRGGEPVRHVACETGGQRDLVRPERSVAAAGGVQHPSVPGQRHGQYRTEPLTVGLRV
ncbi:hypothetical protein [Actinoplanes sp. NPDC051494]|uniref:hypothetical protein n=1 Tax=Actinoplanes sp. NPDC051494 TaxID=3363907 RepID=UPI00379D752E